MKRHNTTDIVANVLVIAIACVIVGLKITNVIKISWLWLLSPIWVSFLLGILIAIVLTIMGFIQSLIDKRRIKNERY